MANKHRGEVELVVGEETYTLRLGINGITEIENILDLGINEIAAKLEDIQTIRVGHLRAILYGALREHHPELTIGEVGNIASEVGLIPVMEAVSAAFGAAFPEAEGDAESPSPKKGRAGTGKGS